MWSIKFREMLFTGELSDLCPISFAPADSLERPVGFNAAHAFECECIVEWLTRHRSTNPITGMEFGSVPVADVVHPLVVDGRCEHVAETQQMLLSAGWVIGSRHRSRAATKFGCDVLLFILMVTHAVSDGLILFFLATSLLVQYPVCGRLIIGIYMTVAACNALTPIVSGAMTSDGMVLHTWSVQLLCTKLVIDVNSEFIGDNIP